MKELLLSLLLAGCFATGLLAGNGYEITVKIDGYQEKELFLAYYYGDKQYVKDTTTVNANGSFVFSGEEPLPGGVYLIVLAPNNDFFQLLIDENSQRFRVETKKEDTAKNMVIKGSPDNELFYGYMNFLAEKRPEAETLRAEIDKAGTEGKDNLQKKLDQLNKEVEDYQNRIIRQHPKTFTAAIIRANLPMNIPEYEGEEQEVQIKRWRYTQNHYFENIDLADPRLLRSPFLFQRIDYFVNKLQVQHPDTLSMAIDQVLNALQPAEESFKFYLIHFLNFYARSKIVGMDAVYVHLVDHYYAKGLAPWTEEEQLQKIIENANTLRPLLIGRIAPDIRLQKRDGTPIALHQVDAEYTILYFWRYDCGHCKESTPHMKAFYEKFREKGVKLVAVCAKYTDEVPKCWEYVDENDIQDWIHTVDPYGRSRYQQIYDIRSTPQIYILDRNKEILSKRIGAEQLEEVMDRIIEMKEQEKTKGETTHGGR